MGLQGLPATPVTVWVVFMSVNRQPFLPSCAAFVLLPINAPSSFFLLLLAHC